ncbi:MAG: hypothetical protein U0269_17980 [Polyangiales bacterium]
MQTRYFLLSIALVALAACGAPSETGPADARTERDSASIERDSSVTVDASAQNDSSVAQDSGAASDVSAPSDASAGCVGRPAQCASGTAGGACGDTLTPPTCSNGEWTCGAGMVFVTSCACVGRPPASTCTCTASGWRCDDSGVGRRFPCGDALTCLGGAEYCIVTLPGVPGALRTFECRALPAACGAMPSCACVMPPRTAQCALSSSGDVTVTIALP